MQKSQGQIFQEFVECVECQECQGQMPRSNPKVKFPKVKWENKNGKNPKVKYFRNFRNVWNVKVKSQGQMPRSNFPRSNGKIKMGKIPRSNGKIKMCRNHHQEKMCKNPKVKNFRNVWNVRNVKTENSQKLSSTNF